MATQKPKVQPKAVKTEKAVTATSSVSQSRDILPFTKMNYILLLVGIGMISLGFFLMRGPFVDSKTFSVPLHISPLLVVGGFIEIVFAIMYKPRTPKSEA
ncbi:MAG: DUF3098 domain-containing protein [Bacteroidia bacterium]|nr:DUF3098 domain-containing protein [Bacteroidia bacterium]